MFFIRFAPTGRARWRSTGTVRIALRNTLFLLMGPFLLGGCVHGAGSAADVNALSPLRLGDREVSVADVSKRVVAPQLLHTDADMRDFVRRYTEGLPRGRPRLMSLHRAIRGRASLGIDYDPAAEGTAREVFHRGSANCLAYATLFIALAREAGLDANYQWLKVRPQWAMRGERVMVRLHVNVMVEAGRNDWFMVDIDPVPKRDVAGSRRLADSDAEALHHANIAMFALAEGRTEEAWLQSVRALQLSPEMTQLWVNIGAVYRFAGQHREAEAAYMQALSLEPGYDSAMNNLVVLYQLEGREAERAHWAQKVERYREKNPYYQAWLGDQAADQGNWRLARQHYQRAVQIEPQDSRLLYALGLANDELGEPALATDYIRRAIEHATLRSDVESYRQRLRELAPGAPAGG